MSQDHQLCSQDDLPWSVRSCIFFKSTLVQCLIKDTCVFWASSYSGVRDQAQQPNIVVLTFRQAPKTVSVKIILLLKKFRLLWQPFSFFLTLIDISGFTQILLLIFPHLKIFYICMKHQIDINKDDPVQKSLPFFFYSDTHPPPVQLQELSVVYWTKVE